ncbi:MAG: flagellar hook-associated family protein [Parvibaculaceae bacterium]
MKTSLLSTLSMTEATRQTLFRLQRDLVTAQKEATTGRLADVGLSLGQRTGQVVSLRYDHARLEGMVDTNGLVGARLDVTQHALGSVLETANDFLSSLMAGRSSQIGADVIQPGARTTLDALIGALNASTGSEHLFAGINTDVAPVTDYYATPTSPARTAVADAFMATFGFAQDSPAAAGISTADMQTFLDTTFAGLFDAAGWSADWSSASDQNIRSRISMNELADVGVNANEAAFRKLAQAAVMVSDLGLGNLNAETARTVLDNAFRIVGEATSELTRLQANVGTVQAQVARASERMSLQIDILTTRINDQEGVDPYEAATRVSALLNQIETSYALTGRLQNLSLLNYL